MKYFNECELVFISNFGTGVILAQNASISINRNIDSVNVIGRRNVSENQIKLDETSVSFSYFPNISDPVFKCFEYVRTGAFENSFPESQIPIVLKVAGISGSFYPNNFSVDVSPNSKAKVSTSFSNFSDISGLLTSKMATNNLNSGSGIPHAWSVRVSGHNPVANYNVLEASYSSSISWSPIYAIGRLRPSQVDLANGEESMEFLIDDAGSNFFSGVLSGAENVKINFRTFGGDTIFLIDTSGSKIDSSDIGININDFAGNKISLKRAF